MEELTASNGYRVSKSGLYGIRGGFKLITRDGEIWSAMREFFAAERDEELGFWRDPAIPGYFASPVGSSENVVQVVKEVGGIAYGQFRRGEGVTLDPMSQVAANYFRAHPERPKITLPQGQGAVIWGTGKRRDLFFRQWVTLTWFGVSTRAEYTDEELIALLGDKFEVLVPEGKEDSK